jgi:cell division protein ZapD
MRTFLRLEFLYSQALYHAEFPEPWNSRAAVTSLLDILAITGRGDVRSDVMKELERQVSLLESFRSRNDVDSGRLQTVLGNLQSLRAELAASGSQFTQELKENEFLSAIKHRSAIPGGTCEFDLPIYSHWLNQEYGRRNRDLSIWLGNLRPLCDSVAELLWLIRESAERRNEIAQGGLFQHALDRNSTRELLRVTLRADSELYPEISGSQHRFTVRFLEWHDVSDRPTQTSADVGFELGLC